MDLMTESAAHIETAEALCDGTKHLAPTLDWSEMNPCDHFVQFYEKDTSLVDAVSGFIGAGIEAGDACLVIATKDHRIDIDRQLRLIGIDVSAARARGQYVALDAAGTLSGFMRQDSPDALRFQETVGRMVAQAAEGKRRVRAFGEMVALLWSEGNQSAAIQLEDLWNDLAQTHSFCLFCAYPMDSLGGDTLSAPFTHVCKQHSRVIPAESYSALHSQDDRLREITLLQQRAASLEAEVAQRKEAEKALLQRERELSDFFENSLEGMHRVGPDGIILWANRAETELLGYRPEEYIGQHISEFHADTDVIADMLSRLLRGEALYNHPARLRCKDGSIKHVLIHSNACFEDGMFVYTRCFTRDVTERQRMEDCLAERLCEIEALNARLKRSMTETHHRVKNNLQVVSAMIELQAMEHGEDKSVPLEEFTRLKSHVRTLAIVHDLLTTEIKEHEDIQFISTKAVLDRLLPMLQQTAWKQTVRFDIADAEIPSKQCVSLALVINELVSNALKHGKTEADVSLLVDGQDVVLEVCDDGPGFPEGFNSVSAANTGLELVDSLVRTDLGAEVYYENRAEGGARVKVLFPLPDTSRQLLFH